MKRSRNHAAGGVARGRLAQYAPLATAISAVLAGVPAAYAAEDKASGALEDVVVTAQKRSENLQDVPVSIQALGNEKLDELHVVNLDNYVKFLPSVTINRGNGQGNSGQPGTSHVYMRGINSGGDGNHSGSQPSVGTYLDEEPMTTADGTMDVHVYDIARVEVLAGPQGTLYGASSQAGTIRIITNKADPKAFAAGYDVTVNQVGHGGTGYTIEGFVNLPLTPTAAIRLVGWDEHDAGFISNVAGTSAPGTGIVNGERIFPSWDAANEGDGTVANAVINAGKINNSAWVKKDYNVVDTKGARGSLRFILNDDWTVTPGFMFQNVRADGFFGYDPNVGFLKVTHFAEETSSNNFAQGSLTVEGKIANLDVVYAGATMKRQTHSVADYSDYSFFYDKLYGSGNYFYDNNYTLMDPAQQVHSNGGFEKWSHELRFSTPKENRLRATFGGFLQRQLHNISENYFMPGISGNMPGLTGPALADWLHVPGWPNTIWLTQQQRVDRDKAIFGELSFDITDKLTVTAGGRLFWNENSLQGFYGYSAGFSPHGSGVSKCGPPGGPPDPTYQPSHGAPCTNLNQSVKENGNSPRVNFTYKLTPDKMLFATYSKGFRPGGVNRTSQAGIPPYKADFLTNIELGWKTQWLGHRVRWNGAVFQEDWKDFQFAFLGPNSVTVIVNGGQAKVQGLESELEWMVTPSFSLSSAVTWLPKDELTQDYCGTQGVTSCPDQHKVWADGSETFGPYAPSGTRLPQTPKIKANIVARYTFDLGGWDGNVQAAYVYQTETSQKLRLIDADHLGSIGAYGLLDLSAGLARNGMAFDLFVTNAADSKADLTRFTQCTETVCGLVYHIPVQPRTIGLKFGQKFYGPTMPGGPSGPPGPPPGRFDRAGWPGLPASHPPPCLVRARSCSGDVVLYYCPHIKKTARRRCAQPGALDETGQDAGTAGNRGDRRRLGRTRPAFRHRRDRRRREAGDGGVDPRLRGERRARAGEPDERAAAAEGQAHVHDRPQRDGRQGRFHSGEHPGAAAAEAAHPGAGQPARGRRRHHRLEHLGPHAIRPAAGHALSGAADRRPPVQPGLPAAAGRTRRRRQDGSEEHRGGRRVLHLHRHARAARAPRSAGPSDGPAPGSPVARDPAHGERGRRDHPRARRIDHLWPGPALGRHGHQPDLPPRRWRAGHAPHAPPVRSVPEVAVDQARGPGAHRRADRPDGRGYRGAGGRPLDPRAREAA
jgi:outer membrane receptor protein involved in Fe transport